MQENPRGRAYRRHHYQRLKAKRIRERYWGIGWDYGVKEWDEGALGVAVNTPHPHSCPFCTNVRSTEGDTLQERRSQDSFNNIFDAYLRGEG